MIICPKCGCQNTDDAELCANCSVKFIHEEEPQNIPPINTFKYVDPHDHTDSMDEEDIKENKVFAIVPYLFGWIGIIVGLLGGKESKFAMFHIKEAIKLNIVLTLICIIALILCWTIIVPILAGVVACVMYIVKIICFFIACSGKAKEAPILSSITFLK